MTLKLNAGLAASILVGAALAPVAALTAQPAGASTQVCIDDQSYSLTTKISLVITTAKQEWPMSGQIQPHGTKMPN